MQINQERQRDALIVALVGRIDTTASETLEQHLATLAATGERRIVIDLAGVDYVNSTGLRVLLSLAKRMRENEGALVLCGLGGSVQRVFELAGLLPLFTVAASRDEAAGALSS